MPTGIECDEHNIPPVINASHYAFLLFFVSSTAYNIPILFNAVFSLYGGLFDLMLSPGLCIW
jgi:hypothetical protein